MGLPNIGPLELIIILAIALLIVGPGRLPEMGSAIGRTIREFRKAASDVTDGTTSGSRTDQGDPQPNTLSRQVTPNSMTVASEPAEPSAVADDQPARMTVTGPRNGDESRADTPGSA